MLKQEEISDAMIQDQLPDGANFSQSVPPKDDDEKSDFDPLFDDEPDADGDAPMQLITPTVANSLATVPAIPSHSQPPSQPRQSTIFRNAPGAPPVLDPVAYNNFSPDILMTAAIDGQVMLWDRRVHSPGQGVGRLPMGEKTRPWCVSVGIHYTYGSPSY